MNRQERNKQKKQKARQERLRREKHRQSPPRGKDWAEPATAAAVPPVVPAASSVPNGGQQAEGGATARSSEPLDNFFLGEPAREWLGKLLAGTDPTPIVHALDPALDLPAELLLKASVCCEMLVAAEVVAAQIGRPSRHLPPRVLPWLRELDMDFTPGVVMLAARAVRRVGEFSELRQLWDQVGLGQEWLRGVQALHERLSG
jgi:hypothetical protein